MARLVPACIGSVIAALVLTAMPAGAQPPSKTVLAIYAGPERHPANLMLDEAIEKALAASPEARIDLLTEYLDIDGPQADTAPASLRDYIAEKYNGRHIDVVLAPSDGALRFVLDNRAPLFPGAAIVWSGVALPQDVIDDARLPITGVRVGAAYLETLKMALALHPSVDEVLIVARTIDGMVTQPALEAELAPVKDRVRLTYVAKRTVEEMLSVVRAAPANSLVLYLWHQPAEWSNFIYPDTVAKLVADASPVPVYGTHEMYVGLGVVGGVVRLTSETGARLGEMTRMILAGTRARDIPIENARLTALFDARQLRRWHVDRARLPAGAAVRFETPTLWQEYRNYIIATVVIVAGQLALIAALLAQRARRRRAEKVIKAREEALRTSYSQIRRLAARLLQAQEAARSAIARDLHDDFCQKLALVGIGISSLKQSPTGLQDPLSQRALSELEQRTQGLFDDVRRLSHDLHPASLRVLGLGPALSAFVTEIEARQNVRIDYKATGDLTHLDPDVSVCLFRLAQEAVRNAVTHGHARHINIAVTRSHDAIDLTVADDGRGFDLNAAREQGGLGLISMEERANSVGGTIEIVTAAGQGTTVHVGCPVEIQDAVRAG
jgi:signal transduction histidine kinase